MFVLSSKNNDAKSARTVEITTLTGFMKRSGMTQGFLCLSILTLLCLGVPLKVLAQQSTQNLTIPIAIVIEQPTKPNSVLASKLRSEDLAAAGAQLGVSDSNTTGRFLKQHFSLTIFEDKKIDELEQQVSQWEQQHQGPIIAVGSDALLSTLLSNNANQRLVVNAANRNDNWRTNQCQPRLLHTIPSQAMLSDALAQFMVLKRWQKWLLVSSADQQDQTIAASYKRSAKRFGSKVVGQREWSFSTDLRRMAQQEVPTLTQGKDYDVVIVTDAHNQYGFYLPYNTWLPRPVAGTHGLTPAAWHHSIEQWGAVQLQNRFNEFTGRDMQNEDYAAWLAVRAIAEAVTRTKSNNPNELYQYMMSDKFELAAFKGRKLTFRNYNGQLRQPIPLAQPDALVSQSPQQGFLHPLTDLDTLGYDKPEVKCNMDEV
ncbi:ABC transporter substrate-binding protein [Aliiglaciecola sp. SL4]|uniref:ABC transporter substrate-binding protein n=1 Tax=Aliiglaciecola sp. SL4 TaxID=3239806 RepID=UPI00355BC8AF